MTRYLLALLTLLACGGSMSTPTPPEDAGEAAAPDAAQDSPVDTATDAPCLRCVGDTWWDVCPATPVRQPDAESCAFCGGHCDGG